MLTAVRFAIRRHQLSRRTEQAYLDWVRRYVRFHHLRHPAELGEAELVAFVTDLAARGRVAPAFSRSRRLGKAVPALGVRAAPACGLFGLGVTGGAPERVGGITTVLLVRPR